MSGHAAALSAAATSGSHGLWLVSRGTGLVMLVLFSLIMVLGVAARSGAATRRWPRFTIAELHRTMSLFAVALLGLHVSTALLDPYVSISWIATVLPFASHYETLAIGAGALAVDFAGAVLITSLVRARLGRRAWRAVHYLAYLAWPAAFVHSITAASYDQHLWWVVATEIGCLAAVVTAVLVRLLRCGRPDPGSPRYPSHERPPVASGVR